MARDHPAAVLRYRGKVPEPGGMGQEGRPVDDRGLLDLRLGLDMRIKLIEPPRVFRTGRGDPIEIKDCARIELAPDEQVTFVTPDGKEYDVARKSWGFYATPSLNGRLLDFGLRAVLVRSHVGKHYLFLVESGR